MRIIFVDHPAAGEEVRACQVFDGWTVSPVASEAIAIKVNGRPAPYHEIPRPDVEAAHPGLNAKGFMFFFEPDPAIKDYRVHLRIGDAERDLSLTVAPDELAQAAETAAIRESHKAFLDTALACPNCHAPIGLRDIADRRWNCPACGTAFDCRAGLDLIPESFADRSSIRFHGAICSHPYDEHVEAVIARAAASNGMVLDCGAGWRNRIRPNVITTEILRYPSTDVVAVSEHLPFRDGAFDAVLSLHVLEHVRNPFVCAKELVRVLKPGGTLLAVTPYIVGVHGYPFHFFNPTPSGLRALFDGMIVNPQVSVPRVAHPLAALKDLLSVYANYFDPADREAFRNTKIGELLDSSFETVLNGHLVKSFRKEGENVLSGNYIITGSKA